MSKDEPAVRIVSPTASARATGSPYLAHRGMPTPGRPGRPGRWHGSCISHGIQINQETP